MDIQTTLIYVLVATFLSRWCNPFIGMFNQQNVPYLLSWALGLVFGDWKTGLIIGAAVTTLNMAPVIVGGVASMMLWDAAVLCVALVLGTGMELGMAFAIAAPVAVLGNALTNVMFVALYDSITDPMTIRSLKKGNIKGVILSPSVFKWCLNVVWTFTWYFIMVYFGTRAADALVNAMPDWIISGFVAGGKLLPAVGFGLFLAAMGKRKFIPFFIIGVYANLYLGLSTMKIAVMAACIGFIFVLLEKGKRDGVLEGGN